MDKREIKNIVEAILFVAGEPISSEKLSETLDIPNQVFEKTMGEIMIELNNENRGVRIIKTEYEYQMCSNPTFFPYIEKLYSKPIKIALSESTLETLAIIVYKQPVTKNDISEIRGINCDYHVNKLISYNLICEKGRLDTPGRPILLGTTNEFLKFYGISNISELPIVPLANIEDEAKNEIELMSLINRDKK